MLQHNNVTVSCCQKEQADYFALHLQILVLAVAATSPYLIFIQSSDCVVPGLVCLYGPSHRKLILFFSFPSKGFSCISSSMAALSLDLKHRRIRLSVLLLFFFFFFFYRYNCTLNWWGGRTFIFSSSVCVQVPICRDILMLIQITNGIFSVEAFCKIKLAGSTMHIKTLRNMLPMLLSPLLFPL